MSDKYPFKFQKKKQTEIKTYDLSQTLPTRLHKRVAKIVKLPSLKDNKFEEEKVIDLDAILEKKDGPKEPKDITSKAKDAFNESTTDAILDAEREYLKIDLVIEPEPKPRKIVNEEINWLANYIRKNKKDRIKWSSKLYNFDRKLLQKPMFEQAEELIDLAASDFTTWINELSSDSKTNISKELIKDLFPIGLEGDASKALYVEPRQIRAVPNEVALSWDLPQVYVYPYRWR